MAKKSGSEAKGVEEAAGDSPRSATRLRNNSLTLLGSAAVLGIYAAGYARTDEAARQIEAEIASRSPVPGQLFPKPLLEGATDPREPVAGQAPPTVALSAPVGAEAGEPPSPGGEAAESSSTSTTLESAAAPDAEANSVPPAVAPPAAVARPTPAPPSAPVYHDGLHVSTGWRTQHGDMQATVEIVAGRIVSATVTRCGMRWPCADIAALMARVPQIQSANVGSISGATQSSEAFNSAVARALYYAAEGPPR